MPDDSPTELLDGMELSLLDVGLTTEQIEKLQEIIQEAGAVMMNHLVSRLSDEGYTQEQMGSIIKNLFGYLMNGDHVSTLSESVDIVFNNTESEGDNA